MSIEFSDDFAGAAADLDGRVSLTGHVWNDGNDRFQVNGSGLLEAKVWTDGGRYADVHLSEGAVGMSAVGIWGGTSDAIGNNAGIVLICSAVNDRPGSPGSYGIYYNAVHPVFGDWQTGIDIWIDGAGTRLYTHNYAARLDRDTPYEFGWTLDGTTLIVDCPDGTTHNVTDSRWPTWIGAHLIYQIYNSGNSANQPRIESVNASIADPTPPVAGTLLSLGGSVLAIGGQLLAIP